MPVLGCVLLGAYAIAQFVAAIWGLDDYVGWFAPLIIALCLYFRFTLPVTIFAFLGAKNDWGWHWIAALFFVAPGLIFIIPSILAELIQTAAATIRNRTST